MSEKPKVSIIVPVYRAERYVKKCIESLLQQSYSPCELILIDNGSDDASGRICDEYRTLLNVKIVHLPTNIGISGARNQGIMLASGEYLAFVDSDDFVKTTFIETLVAAEQATGTDIVQCAYCDVWNDQPSDDFDGAGEIVRLTNYQAIDMLLGNSKGSLINAVVWNKLYRTSLVRKSLFASVPCEDMVFVAKLLLNGATIAVSQKIEYFYRQYINSTMGGVNRDIARLIDMHISAYREIAIACAKQDVWIQKIASARLANWYVSAIRVMVLKRKKITAVHSLYADAKSFDFAHNEYISKTKKLILMIWNIIFGGEK